MTVVTVLAVRDRTGLTVEDEALAWSLRVMRDTLRLLQLRLQLTKALPPHYASIITFHIQDILKWHISNT